MGKSEPFSGRIARAFPDLRGARVTPLASGWDHDVVRMDDLVFRFPRTEMARSALAIECALLPFLAPLLPVDVPVPTRIAEGFVAHRFLPGETLAEAVVDDDARAAIGRDVARFVAALHAVDPARAPVPIPGDALGRFDVARRAPESCALLARLRDEGVLTDVRPLQRLLEEGVPASTAAPVLVHADLHARNLLVDAERGSLSGVLDWVDVHRGDPACDFAFAFEIVPPRARDALLRDCDEATVRRARWRAVDRMTRALAGARQMGDAPLARAAQRALLETS